MDRAQITHVGFSDESNWNKGRFRSLGLVSCRLASLENLEAKLRHVLEESKVSEFKWQKLRTAKERFAAEKMCHFAVDHAIRGLLRIDVLIWDTHDTRHGVPGRDDIANLQRMYYHLFRNVLRARWPSSSVWRLHPDENTALDWNTVQDCLESASKTLEVVSPDLMKVRCEVSLRSEYGLEEIRPVASKDHSLLQLADLFAGMAVFSRDKYRDYEKWLPRARGQLSLPIEDGGTPDLTGSMEERFQVLRNFDCLCKKKGLGVSLKSRQGLWTPNPEKPLNFWPYMPQHAEDRAPRRSQK